MRYTSTINNLKCIEWELTLSQAFLMDILIISEMWAKRETIDGIDYRWVSRGKVLEEIPHAYKTADRVYRALKDLSEKGVIDYKKLGKKDLIRITDKGKQWVFHEAGFEKRLLGKKAEKDNNSVLKTDNIGFNAEKEQDNSVLKPTYNGVDFNNGVEVNNKNADDGFDDVYLRLKNKLRASGVIPIGKPVIDENLRPDIYQFVSWCNSKNMEAYKQDSAVVAFFKKKDIEDRKKYYTPADDLSGRYFNADDYQETKAMTDEEAEIIKAKHANTIIGLGF